MRRRMGGLMLAAWSGWLGLMVGVGFVGLAVCPELCPAAQAQAQTPAQAQTAAAKSEDEGAIRAALAAQTNAWNHGDIAEFMATYEDSPETTFVGATAVRKGFTPILERYKKNYPNKEQMGTLSFSDLDVRLLPSASGVVEFAVVTGRFHLKRTAKSEGAKDDGIFSLVWHKSAGGWKIVLDHTS